MVLVDNPHSSPLVRSFSQSNDPRHQDDRYDQYLHHRFVYGESMSPPQPFSMDWANHTDQDKHATGSSPWPTTMQVGNTLVYPGSDLGDSSVPQSSNGSGSASGLYMTGWDAGSIDAGSHRGSLTESQAGPVSLAGSFAGKSTVHTVDRCTSSDANPSGPSAGSIDGSSPSFSRNHRPSQLNLDHSNHLHHPLSLPLLTSQLALQTPGGISPTGPELLSSSTHRSRHSASSVRESDYGAAGGPSSAGPSSVTFQSPRHSASDPQTVWHGAHQSLPMQAQHQPALRYPVGQLPGGQWSEAYVNNAQTPMAMTTSGQPYQLVDARYPRGSMDVPPWGYQNVPTHQIPSQLPPPGTPAMRSSVGMYPSAPPSNEFYYSQPPPPGFFLTVPPVSSPSPMTRTSTTASGSRSKGRKKVAIGRVRLPAAHSRSTSPSHAQSQPENPWERMQQSSSLSGAYTHSGVYGLEPSDGRAPFWAPQQQQMTRPAGAYEMHSQGENSSTVSTMGYYAPNTAELYHHGSVSIPATVATSHVMLPNAHMAPPMMMMNPSAEMHDMRKPSMTAGTPASMCNSTFSSMDDDLDNTLSGDSMHPVAAHSTVRVPSGSNMSSRAPTQLHQLDHSSEDDEHEELQDVRNVYPGLSDAERSGRDGKGTSTEENSTHSNSLGSAKKKTIRRVPPDPVNMMDFSRYTARSPRLKLAIACQGCRDKKLKCSGERPMCLNCKRRGLEVCEYAETIRRRGPGRKKLAASEKKAKNQSRRGLGEDDESRGDYRYEDYEYRG